MLGWDQQCIVQEESSEEMDEQEPLLVAQRPKLLMTIPNLPVTKAFGLLPPQPVVLANTQPPHA